MKHVVIVPVVAALVAIVAFGAGCPPPEEHVDAGPPPGAKIHVKKGGDGKGAIASLPDGISCDNDCINGADFTFSSETTKITLTATAARDALFDNWHCDGAKNGIPLTSLDVQNASIDVVNDAKPEGLEWTCTAAFRQLWTIQIVFSGSEQQAESHGHVVGVDAASDGNGSRIDCPTKCTAGYFNGDSETLSVTADNGYVFGGWKLDCASAANGDATLTLDANKNCEAHMCPSTNPTCTD